MQEQTVYTNLSDANFQREVLQNPEPVLVEFGADWCGPCHIVAPILKDLASEFKGKIKVCQMDIDHHKQIAHQHGIQGIPTFLFFKEGEMVDRMVGVVSKEVLTTKLNALLPTKRGESVMQTQIENPKINQKKTTMKAAVIREFGGPEVIHIEEIEKPQVRAGHVLVKVLAAGVNRLDHYVRGGGYIPEIDSYRILGADAAGEIAELGEGVSSLQVGERVMVVAGFATERKDKDHRPTIAAPSFAFPEVQINGTYTQYMEVPDYAVLKDETGLTVEEAATLPVVLGTSVHALKQVAGVKTGDKVLIHSGASGSGSMQIQVAKALGAKVATTVRSAEKGTYAKAAGADLVINTREENFVKKIKEWTDGAGADVVIDNVGGDVLAQSIEAIRPFGAVVVYGLSGGAESKIDVRKIFFPEKRLLGSMGSDVEDFQWGLEQVKAGRIKPLIYRVLPLDQAAEAHQLIADNKVQGNIVLLPWSTNQ